MQLTPKAPQFDGLSVFSDRTCELNCPEDLVPITYECFPPFVVNNEEKKYCLHVYPDLPEVLKLPINLQPRSREFRPNKREASTMWGDNNWPLSSYLGSELGMIDGECGLLTGPCPT